MRQTCLMVALIFGMASSLAAESLDVWIGTAGGGGSKGIYHCRFDDQAGKLSASRLVADQVRGPGFIALHPSGKVLYAVGGVEGADAVAAFRIAGPADAPELEWIGSEPIGDSGSCQVSVSDDGRMLLTAQYGGGSVAVFRLNKDGSIAQRTQIIPQGPGSGVVKSRQAASHAHWSGFSPDGRFAFVPDLGMDKVVIYKVDAGQCKLTPHGEGISVAGGGPRHMKFSSDGEQIYVLNELDLSVTVFDYDAAEGVMTEVQTIETVPKSELDKEEFSSASEIRVSPSGRYVYAANRGHDTITVFEVVDGRLQIVEREPIRGATPRNFNLDPAGKWLIAAGQDSDSLSVFAVQDDGELRYHRQVIDCPSPICVLIDKP